MRNASGKDSDVHVKYKYLLSIFECRCFVYERSKHGSGRGDFGHNSHLHTHSHTSSGFNSTNSGVVDQIYRVAQSGDATCNGLSAMEGSRTMTLRRGKFFQVLIRILIVQPINMTYSKSWKKYLKFTKFSGDRIIFK